MGKRLSVLIVGGGGREHALAWALARSPRVGRLFVAPGNAGTAALATNVPLPAEEVAGLLAFANQNAIDLTVVGPEAPLAAGIVDRFQAAGRATFGPSADAARLESSKAFAKQFMADAGIPTADFAVFDDPAAARSYLTVRPGPVVVKASGLAAGKGVLICDTADEARAAVDQLMVDRSFGAAGDEIVIEERLAGPELSVLAFCDGRAVVPLPPARDHKRVFDGDHGPNTGGMGAFAPPPDVAAALLDTVTRTVLQPAVDALAARGTPYVGLLFAGLMLTTAGPRVLEFNCRFGDPETQAVLPLLQSDLVDTIQACLAGELTPGHVRARPGACATVVMASEGYPGAYETGRPISGLDAVEDALVFHAGTAVRDGQVVTAGGRVLAVSALGPDVAAAVDRAYTAVDAIHFAGAHVRRDIGRPLAVAAS